MPSFHPAKVLEILDRRSGLQKISISRNGVIENAYVLTDLLGEVHVDDEVIINTTAVELGLGTGGWHFVHWNLSRESFVRPGPGHIMKLKYTSLQFDAGAAEETHQDIPTTLENTPVIACGLHSQVGAVIRTLANLAPHLQISYVMTDGGALPLALSDLVHELQQEQVLNATVTAGNAFGGDLEAVALPSALLMARHVQKADVIVVGMGPGIAGTGTPFGHSGVEVANTLNTTGALAGRGICCVRMSSADGRDRHQGVSHHTLSALALTVHEIAVPIPTEFVADPIESHQVIPISVPDDLVTTANYSTHLTTMGRNVTEDTLFFKSCAASAIYAISLIP